MKFKIFFALFLALGSFNELMAKQVDEIFVEDPENNQNSRQKSFNDFHESLIQNYEEIEEISQIFDYKKFAGDIIQNDISASNEFIEYEFIKSSAEIIINSDQYSDYFDLVESLDPFCRYFMNWSISR